MVSDSAYQKRVLLAKYLKFNRYLLLVIIVFMTILYVVGGLWRDLKMLTSFLGLSTTSVGVHLVGVATLRQSKRLTYLGGSLIVLGTALNITLIVIVIMHFLR
jgi:hypothetical protein